MKPAWGSLGPTWIPSNPKGLEPCGRTEGTRIHITLSGSWPSSGAWASFWLLVAWLCLSFKPGRNCGRCRLRVYQRDWTDYGQSSNPVVPSDFSPWTHRSEYCEDLFNFFQHDLPHITGSLAKICWRILHSHAYLGFKLCVQICFPFCLGLDGERLLLHEYWNCTERQLALNWTVWAVSGSGCQEWHGTWFRRPWLLTLASHWTEIISPLLGGLAWALCRALSVEFVDHARDAARIGQGRVDMLSL